MKFLKSANLLVLGIAVSLVATGCKHRPPTVTPLPGNSGLNGENGPGPGGTAPGEMGGGATANFDPDSMAQDRNAFAADIVYFDYDSATIRPGEASKVSAVASALKNDTAAKVLVEGNADERGTDEYNRALGERRALAAREALVADGVEADRIATRSYGRDRPADSGHNEAAWKKNRRDEFVLLHAK